MKLPHEHNKNFSTKRLLDQMPSEDNFDTAAVLLKTLSDSTRLRLFWILCHTEECIINLSAILDISSPAISHHIRFLKDNDLVVSRKDGKEVYYRSADSEIAKLLHHTIEKVMQSVCPAVDAIKCEHCRNSESTDDISNVHDFLLQNLDKRITIDELSHKFLMNQTTLKKRFKAAYGHSIAAHIKEHRMENAAHLLLDGNLSVSQISTLVGYTSASKFSTSFYNTYGLLPLEYRRKYS